MSGSDILEGWVIGAGDVTDNQAELAIKFYKEVAKTIDGPDADFQTVDISLTGHSLGGGLASYIAALYGRETDSYDAMPFTLAVGQTEFRTTHYNAAWTDGEGVYHEDQIDYDTLQQYKVDPGVTVHSSALIDPYLKQLVYETPNVFEQNNTWDPTIGSNIYGAYLDGEVLDHLVREQITPWGAPYQDESAFYQDYYLGAYGTFPPELNGVDLHSMATLIIRQFADVGGVNDTALPTDWHAAAQYFWPVMYNGEFAEDIGMTDSRVAGSLQTAAGSNPGQIAKYSDILRMIIAYSAIDDGERPFGDTGIRAFYDDANNLGAALAVQNSVSQPYAESLSKVLVHFAGRLALEKVLQSAHPEVLAGALSAPGDGSLTVDFSKDLWDTAGYEGVSGDRPGFLTTADYLVSREELVGTIFEQSGLNFPMLHIRHAWGAYSTGAFEKIVFSAPDGGAFTLPEPAAGSGKATLFVASNGNDEITGSSGNDFILGGAGDDVLDGSSGSDIILAGDGNDNISLTGWDNEHAMIDGGEGEDLLRLYGTGYDDFTVDFQSGSAVVTWTDAYDGQTSRIDVTGIETFLFDNRDAFMKLDAPSGISIETNSNRGSVSSSQVNPSGSLLIADYSSAPSAMNFRLVDIPHTADPDAIGSATLVVGGPSDRLVNIGGVCGTNFGDTYHIEPDRVDTLTIFSGTGNDTVTGSPAWAYYYTGGHDVLSASKVWGCPDDAQARGTVWLPAGISSAEVHVEKISVDSGRYFDLLVTVGDIGTILIEHVNPGASGGTYTPYSEIRSKEGFKIDLEDDSFPVSSYTTRYEVFGTSDSEVLSPSANSSNGFYHLYGLSGDDTINSGAANDNGAERRTPVRRVA